MKTSKIVAGVAVIAITAALVGAAALLPMNTQYSTTSSDAAGAVATTTLEPVIVVATR